MFGQEMMLSAGNQTGAYATSILRSADMTECATPDSISGNLEIAILNALNLVDQINGSISNFEDVLQFAKELY